VTFTLPTRPPEQKVEEDDNKVGSEISRLAQDIADVLTEGEKGFISNPTPLAQIPSPTPATIAAAPPSPEYRPVEYQPAATHQTTNPPATAEPVMMKNAQQG